MSDFKYIGKNIVCEPYTFRSDITASNITASGTIIAKRFVGYIDSASIAISSSYALTSSWSIYSVSSSYSVTASYFSGSITNAISSSYALTSSYALSSSYALTSSYALSSSYSNTSLSGAFAYSSSYALTSSYSNTSLSGAFAYSSSYALSSSHALSSNNTLSSSYSLTASYALNGGSGGGGTNIYVISSSIIDINISSSVDKFVTDGVINTYTLSFTSNNPNDLLVFLDGLEQEPTTDYTVSGNTLTMIPIPPPNLELEIRRFYSAASISIITSSLNAQYFTGDGVTTQYSLTRSVANDYDVLVSFDGLIQKPTYDYTVTGSILNFATPPPLNIDGEIRYLMGSTTGLVSGSNPSSSYALTSSYSLNSNTLDGLNSTIFATTGSNTFIGNQTISSGYLILSQVSSSLNFVDDAAAAVGGVPLGGLYRNGNFILIRLT